MTWRKKAAAVIERVLGENQDADEKTLRAALRAAYPFGLYGQYYPYKVWCEEVRKSIAKHEATRCPACFGRGWVGNDIAPRFRGALSEET